MSMYDPVFAIAMYSPSWEKLSAVMPFLGRRVRDCQLLRGGVGVGSRSGTYSQLVMVRAQIHSDRSNMFTMESWPPDARYLGAINTAAIWKEKHVEALTARVGRERLLRSRRRALLGSRRGRARESPLLATSVLSCE